MDALSACKTAFSFSDVYGQLIWNHLRVLLVQISAVRNAGHFPAVCAGQPDGKSFLRLSCSAFFFKRNLPLIEALAIITLFKYGIWAVVMNLLVLNETGVLDTVGYMLILSHLGMAVQGLLYAPFYRFKAWHLAAAAVWTLHNEIIDYVFGQMPKYSVLMNYLPEIGYFTFWLSLFSIFLAYYFVVRKDSYKLDLLK